MTKGFGAGFGIEGEGTFWGADTDFVIAIFGVAADGKFTGETLFAGTTGFMGFGDGIEDATTCGGVGTGALIS